MLGTIGFSQSICTCMKPSNASTAGTVRLQRISMEKICWHGKMIWHGMVQAGMRQVHAEAEVLAINLQRQHTTATNKNTLVLL
jgi:hypothetical protein